MPLCRSQPHSDWHNLFSYKISSYIHSRIVKYAADLCGTGWRRDTVELNRNETAHGDARVGKWRGKMRMEWVASSLASFIRTLRLPVVDWTDPPADLNGLVRFAERPILVSARVPSRSDSALLQSMSDKLDDVWRCHEMGLNVEITKLLRILRQLYPVVIT